MTEWWEYVILVLSLAAWWHTWAPWGEPTQVLVMSDDQAHACADVLVEEIMPLVQRELEQHGADMQIGAKRAQFDVVVTVKSRPVPIDKELGSWGPW